MTLAKLRAGEVVAGIAGVLLLADLFAPWYREAGENQNAFQAFSAILALLGLCAALGIALFALTAFQPSQAHPVAAAVCGAATTLVTTLLVLYRILNAPGDDDVVSVRWGAYAGLALVLTLLTAIVGALRADQR